MPKMINKPGPDFARIRPYSERFASRRELTRQDITVFERVLKLAAECEQIGITEIEAARLMDLVSNPLRSAIGCGKMNVAPIYGDAVLVITPEPVLESDNIPVCHEHQCKADECGCYDPDNYCQCGLRMQVDVSGRSCPLCDYQSVKIAV